MKHVKTQSGFTLIEVVFYLLFISIILGGTIAAASHLLTNSENLKAGISVEEEGNFILKKMSWVINDSIIIYPDSGAAGSYLKVYKLSHGMSANPIIVDLDSGLLRIKRGTGTPKQLSNDRFMVTDLVLKHTESTNNTKLMQINFKINGKEFSLTRKIYDLEPVEGEILP